MSLLTTRRIRMILGFRATQDGDLAGRSLFSRLPCRFDLCTHHPPASLSKNPPASRFYCFIVNRKSMRPSVMNLALGAVVIAGVNAADATTPTVDSSSGQAAACVSRTFLPTLREASPLSACSMFRLDLPITRSLTDLMFSVLEIRPGRRAHGQSIPA